MSRSNHEIIKKIMLNSTEHKFIMLINVKMPTIVGILTFISTINTTSKSLKARKLQESLFLRAVEIPCSVELSMKKFITSGPDGV